MLRPQRLLEHPVASCRIPLLRWPTIVTIVAGCPQSYRKYLLTLAPCHISGGVLTPAQLCTEYLDECTVPSWEEDSCIHLLHIKCVTQLREVLVKLLLCITLHQLFSQLWGHGRLSMSKIWLSDITINQNYQSPLVTKDLLGGKAIYQRLRKRKGKFKSL